MRVNSVTHEQFIKWLRNPDRWTLPHFHLTDESHSEELNKAAGDLKIDGDAEERLWLVILDAWVDEICTVIELYKIMGPWSSLDKS